MHFLNVLLNSNTMVYKIIFMDDLGYIQSIKQFADNLFSMNYMICLSSCLYIRFEALNDGNGCT